MDRHGCAGFRSVSRKSFFAQDEGRTTGLIAHDKFGLQTSNCQRSEINFPNATDSNESKFRLPGPRVADLNLARYGQDQDGLVQFGDAELALRVRDMGGNGSS
jgi:hypothetical protein